MSFLKNFIPAGNDRLWKLKLGFLQIQVYFIQVAVLSQITLESGYPLYINIKPEDWLSHVLEHEYDCSKLPAVADLDRHRALARLRALGLHCLDNVKAVDDFAEHNVLAIEPAHAEEAKNSELAAVCSDLERH